ncbi:CesT family type III secretion system chaperone [Yersinia nurmii]|uniref:CesT family type III secretion system chaperone n=1 Tax=Yersinia nurmii TaxID=685706 RepID=A0AAW7K202_9GAMM|nr:CesT family type III secretion system chaperone [Yersinia nurmii]MDN0087265.1 CesT family type III secretion system chaperone [Yersinia nurmii]
MQLLLGKEVTPSNFLRGRLSVSHLRQFHLIIYELLVAIGFEAPEIAENQDIITLTIDDALQLNLCAIDQEYWMLQALVGMVSKLSLKEMIGLLNKNRPTDYLWQPVFAFDEKNDVICWLRLPLYGMDIPGLLSIMEQFISDARIERIESDGFSL